ncbi:hypothetical protein Cme02nite_52550 [Catellatospora methionotrophica]|uniref:Uncharacterized protein n=2 Tax=Catellatospora methionotrophica TaxID=121620 RepID=A0A8J3PI01_9ACTN|nr:hypothetical protein [Catellatospora methionotrophica]GIG16923.1 hypothetical protein Cme02nite_52550 [Catellatospora methionotrophica]
MSSSAVVLLGGLPFTLLAVLFLGLLAQAQHRRDGVRPARLSASAREKLTVEVRELEEVAAEVLEAARTAVLLAERTAAELAAAEAERDVAWQAHLDAAQVLEKAAEALPPEPAEAVSSAENLREVSRAARAAYKRGDLSMEQLRAVWQRVDGWDQSRQDHSHELSRLRAEDAEAARLYHVAASRARHARRAAEVARVSSHALTQEAADAAYEAQVIQTALRGRG